MPVSSIEQLQKKEAAFRAKLAEKGESMDEAKRRTERKKLRRTQRKRRRAVVAAARIAPKAAAAPEGGEAKPAEAAATEKTSAE